MGNIRDNIKPGIRVLIIQKQFVTGQLSLRRIIKIVCSIYNIMIPENKTDKIDQTSLDRTMDKVC
jgi:hypothetical protein